MSYLSRIELIEPYLNNCPSWFLSETSIFAPKALGFPFPSFVGEDDDLSFALDLLSPKHKPCDVFDSVTDLIRIDDIPSFTSYRRIQRVERLGGDVLLRRLSDRVSKLESRFDRLLSAKTSRGGDRKYTWTTEIKGPEEYGVDRKYSWTAEIKEGKKEKKDNKKGGIEKNYKLTAEIKEKSKDGPILRKYTFKSSTGDAGERGELKKGEKEKEKKEKKGKKAENCTRLVEIEEPDNHGVEILRQAFARRAGAIENVKGKRKELSPQDAAMVIQLTFRAYLIRRSQALRALRDLAIAKTKLKELRGLFNNFAYRRRISRDAEERQRFSEKIIVLLLTVDAIEGVDLMVRGAKRSMVDELEAMLDVVDPHPAGKSLSMRRTFDMPNGDINKELAAGVAQVVQMLNEEENSSSTIEACL